MAYDANGSIVLTLDWERLRAVVDDKAELDEWERQLYDRTTGNADTDRREFSKYALLHGHPFDDDAWATLQNKFNTQRRAKPAVFAVVQFENRTERVQLEQEKRVARHDKGALECSVKTTSGDVLEAGTTVLNSEPMQDGWSITTPSGTHEVRDYTREYEVYTAECPDGEVYSITREAYTTEQGEGNVEIEYRDGHTVHKAHMDLSVVLRHS